MNPNLTSSSMYNDMHHFQDITDPLDEFLSPLLADIPDVPSMSILPYAPTSAQVQAQAPSIPAPFPGSLTNPTCYWIARSYPPFICGASISPDPRQACAHLRVAHNVRGNDKAVVNCLWYACSAPPMQRGSLIRHILTVHLRLLRWQCEDCGREFSRRGTEHVCTGGRHA